jgi:two-component system, LytTR family, response regulator
MNQILIPTSRGTKTVWEENIIRIEASSNYCKIYFDNDRPLVVAKVLHWFQDNLPGDTFYRIHRTHIVNRIHIANISEHSMLKLSNGDMIQISRRRKTYTDNLLKQSA